MKNTELGNIFKAVCYTTTTDLNPQVPAGRTLRSAPACLVVKANKTPVFQLYLIIVIINFSEAPGVGWEGTAKQRLTFTDVPHVLAVLYIVDHF